MNGSNKIDGWLERKIWMVRKNGWLDGSKKMDSSMENIY